MPAESPFLLSSEVRAFLHERLDVLLDEGGHVAAAAAFGQTLNDLEAFYLDAERLAAGRSIGSGLIEGACKNLVKRRLKQTGACWLVPRANRMAVICATLYSNQWNPHGKSTPKLLRTPERFPDENLLSKEKK